MVFPIAISLVASLPFLGLLACFRFDEKTVHLMEASRAAGPRRAPRTSSHIQQAEFWYGRPVREHFSLLTRG